MCGMRTIRQLSPYKDGIITGSLPRRALNLVYEWLDIHKDELLDNWNRLANFETPQKIEPLK